MSAVILRNEKASQTYTTDIIEKLLFAESCGNIAVRSNVLGHLQVGLRALICSAHQLMLPLVAQQGLGPSPSDRVLAAEFAAAAVDHIKPRIGYVCACARCSANRRARVSGD